MRFSIEGECERIGNKTILVNYPQENLDDVWDASKGFEHIWVEADVLDDNLYKLLSELCISFTISLGITKDIKILTEFFDIKNIMIYVVVDNMDMVKNLPQWSEYNNLRVKVLLEKGESMFGRAKLANHLSRLGYNTTFMFMYYDAESRAQLPKLIPLLLHRVKIQYPMQLFMKNDSIEGDS